MFNDFLESLCESESLVDVGKLGVATQSSYSQWSQENDAMRAVSGQQFVDFAFHTAKEQNPWWCIEWSEPQSLHYIIINNRKRTPFDKIIKDIRVSIISDIGEDILIYSGNVLFGALPNSMPLILPLLGEYKVKVIKIQMVGIENYLHLSNIYCLKKVSIQQRIGKLVFFATRGDGFGERLRTLLNAMSLADKYNGDYKIYWPSSIRDAKDFHAIEDAQEIFSLSFIKKYVVKDLRNIKLVDSSSLNDDDFNFEKLNSFDGILVHQGKNPYNHFIDKISFSNKMILAKNEAMSFPIKAKSAAIHIRSGDVVYSQYRFRDIFYGKFFPIYILFFLIEKIKRDGFDILLFSLEKDLCEYIAKQTNTQYINSNLISHFDKTQSALFEIVLMSRCEKIISTNSSGFSIFPALIGRAKKVDSYKNFLNISDFITEFRKSLEPNGLLNLGFMNPLLKAYSISHFLNSYSDCVDTDFSIKLMDMCVMLDPENSFYKLLQSLFYYKKEDFNKADLILLNELKLTEKPYNIYWLSQDFEWRSYTTLSQYIASFKMAADKGSIVAAVLVLINQYYMDKNINKDYFENILNNAQPTQLGVDLLRIKLKELLSSE